jgi:hypothetical protein
MPDNRYVAAIGLAAFGELGFDDALRMFLQGFRLPGEAAPIERCMEAFATTFTKAQPELFAEADTPFLLAYSTIMLNTDLHNESQKHKMTRPEFVSRNQMVCNDEQLTPEYLGTIFDRIQSNEIQMVASAGAAMDISSVAQYSKPRMQGYVTKYGHTTKVGLMQGGLKLGRNKRYWCLLKRQTLMLLDKPPALNSRAQVDRVTCHQAQCNAVIA